MFEQLKGRDLYNQYIKNNVGIRYAIVGITDKSKEIKITGDSLPFRVPTTGQEEQIFYYDSETKEMYLDNERCDFYGRLPMYSKIDKIEGLKEYTIIIKDCKIEDQYNNTKNK